MKKLFVHITNLIALLIVIIFAVNLLGIFVALLYCSAVMGWNEGLTFFLKLV